MMILTCCFVEKLKLIRIKSLVLILDYIILTMKLAIEIYAKVGCEQMPID